MRLRQLTESSATYLKDDNGKPLVAFHSTDREFDRFDRNKSAQGVHWFTTDLEKLRRGESGAAGHGRIIKAHLKMSKPAGWDEYDKYFLDQLESMGYDGLILDDDYVVFDDDQIEILGVVK